MITSTAVCEAIAGRIAQLWPDRYLYRDACPANFERPSGFLYMTKSKMTPSGPQQVDCLVEAQLELFCRTDAYDITSTEELRRDQEQVLLHFGGQKIQVGNRWLTLTAQGDGMEVGSAFVVFSATWRDQRPGSHDPADPNDPVSAAIPKMEDFEWEINSAGQKIKNRKDEV